MAAAAPLPSPLVVTWLNSPVFPLGPVDCDPGTGGQFGRSQTSEKRGLGLPQVPRRPLFWTRALGARGEVQAWEGM